MSAPVAAPRTGARPKILRMLGKSSKNQVVTPPPAPTRKKKTSAPSPPNGDIRQVNSTMTSSATSLLSVKEDISMIRPHSGMSNGSLSSSVSNVSTIRSHKKRRAPPPPVRVITVNDDTNDVNNVAHEDNGASHSQTVVIVDDEDINTTNHETIIDTSQHVADEKSIYATVNKKRIKSGNEVVNEVVNEDRYEVGESAINLSDDNEESEVIVITETVEDEIPVIQCDLLPEDTQKENNQESSPVIENEVSQQLVPKLEESHEAFPKVDSSLGAIPKVEEKSVKKKKKKKADDVKEDKEDPDKAKKKRKKSKDRVKEVEKTEEVIKVSNEKKHESNLIAEKIEEDNVSDVPESELPSFRGAKAAEVHRINESEENQEYMSRNKNEIESDILVNSDDELMDLFTRNVDLNAKKRKNSNHIRKRSSTQEGKRDSRTIGDSDDDFEASINHEDAGNQEMETPDNAQDIKVILERKKEEIKQSMQAGRSSKNAEESEDEDLTPELKSEILRHQLKNLQLGDAASVPLHMREKKAIELDIKSDEELIPSLASSRASSVTNLADDEDRKEELEFQFAVKEMQRGADTKIKTVQDIHDNFDVENNLEKKSTVHEAIVIDDIEESDDDKREAPPDVHDYELPPMRNFNIENDKNENKSIKRGLPGVDIARLHVDVTNASNDLEIASVADSIKSPSPDSGIHDFTDSCSSPVSVTQEDPVIVVRNETGNLRDVSVIGLDNLDIHADVVNKKFDKQDNEDYSDVYEKVDLPKTHNFDKVLFSMSSYNDRKCVEQSSDLFKSESYTTIADKLNTSLAAGQKLKQGPVGLSRPRETKPQVPARNYDKVPILTGFRQPQPHQDSHQDTQNYANMTQPGRVTPVTHHNHSNPISREVDGRPRAGVRSRPVESHQYAPIYEPISVKSKIIEEYQAKKGIVLLGRSHSSSLDRAGQSVNEEPMSNVSYSSLERGSGYFARTRSNQDENHYDSPRSLLITNNSRSNNNNPYHRNDGHYPNGPPSIQMGVWKDQNRHGHVIVREDPEHVSNVPRRKPHVPHGPHEHESIGNIGTIEHSSQYKISPPGALTHGDNYYHRDERFRENRKYAPVPPPPFSQPKHIEIRYKNGKASEVIDDPRKVVLQGSRSSRGDYENGININHKRSNNNNDIQKPQLLPRPKLHYNNTPKIVDIEPAIIPKITEKKVREYSDRNDYHSSESNMLPDQTFYFGQTPPKYKLEDTPSLTTAVGKVRNNEALSQPFRQHPRHEPRKTSNTLPKHNSTVPNLQETGAKVIVVKNLNNDNLTMNNNNNNSVSSKNKMPPRERDQDEVNKEFQNELLRAKSKLSKVNTQKSTYLGDSLDESVIPAAPVPPPGPPGPPGPPPPPTLVKTPVNVNARPVQKPQPSNLNAREELMVAIRNKGGLGGLRKTGFSLQ